MSHEIIMHKIDSKLMIYDYGENQLDRYTVIFRDDVWQHHNGEIRYTALALGDNPFHPQGFCQHCEITKSHNYKHLGKRIKFAQLPEDCQKAVMADMQPTKGA